MIPVRLLLAIATYAFALQPAPLAAQPRGREAAAEWRWEAPDVENRRLHLRFVRGNVRIERRPGPMQVEIRRTAITGYAADAEILIFEDPGSITISDRYPRGSPWFHRESLPPTDERGDFWHSIVMIDVTVRAPASAYVQVELMDGHVEGADRCSINADPRCVERRRHRE